MKNTTLTRSSCLLFLVFLLLSTVNLNASHVAGGYLSYSYISTNQYELKLTIFRDCSPGTATMPGSASICYSSTVSPYNSTVTLTLDSSYQLPYISCASLGLIQCGQAFAYEKYVYSGIVTLPFPAPDWKFQYQLCCRNYAITTITGPGGTIFTISTSLNSMQFPVNSSPVYNISAYELYCAGNLTFIDYSAVDPDGDSLVYELISCRNNINGICPYIDSTVNYIAPHSALNPLSSYTPISLNPTNGIFSFTPYMIQVGILGLRISEYRNGTLVGSMEREDQIAIVQGISNPAIASGKLFFDSNGNGALDAGESGISNRIIEITNSGNILTNTDSSGDYSVHLVSGSFDISAHPINYFHIPPAVHTINVSALGQNFNNLDFAVSPVANITDLEVSLTGFHSVVAGSTYLFNIKVENKGTVAAGGTLDFQFPNDYSFVSCSPSAANTTSTSIEWNVPLIAPFSSMNFTAQLFLDTATIVGTSYNLNASVAAVNDTFLSNNSDSLYQLVVAAYDPNAKFVFPDDPITPLFLSQSKTLEYTIHFQNLGSAPAQTVIINDAIDPLLDISSLQFKGASHPCQMILNPSRLLQFRFDNINLPHASLNEPASKGFVSFSIMPITNLQPGQSIVNGAGIIFDFNAPIYTNFVYSHYPAVNSAGDVNLEPIHWNVYPNPASGHLIIECNADEKMEFRIVDLLGKEVKAGRFSSKTIIDVNQLSKGLYLLRLFGNGNTQLKKFIIAR